MPERRPLTPEDYLAILRRKWPLILIPALLGPVIGYGVSLAFRSRYTSQTMVLIERQKVPDDYVKPVITEDLNARLANIQEQTLSRTRLQPLIEKYRIFKDDAAHKSSEELVLQLQKAIVLTPLKPIVQSHEGMVPGFQIAVTLDDARTAQQVCADITSMFVDENLRQRTHSAQGTTSFLQGQLADAKRNLDEQDAKLATFKRKNMGMLPDDTQTLLNLLTTFNTQLEAVTQALNRAQQDKAYIGSVLAQQVQAWEITRAMRPGAGMISSSGPEPSAAEKRLADLDTYLTSLKTRYTPDHPEVIKVQAEIETLKKQLASVPSAPKQKSSDDVKIVSAPEPPQIQQLRAQARSYDSIIQTNSHEQDRLRNQIRQFESRLQLSPAVEQQYKEITRDYQTALSFYNDLLKKTDQSSMATDLERRQEGEQFRVMDPASLPEKPSFPNRPLFALAGLGIGLGLGLATALLTEQADKRIRTERDIGFYLGVPAFALIPSMDSFAGAKQLTTGNGHGLGKSPQRAWKN